MNQALTPEAHSGCGAEKGLISVDEALQMIMDQTQSLGAETILLNQALHRYLAAPIHSAINLPLFSQSAVDGYAICANQEILPNTAFELIGEIRAGQPVELELKEGQALRIFTGAKIPAGTTTVARQEIIQLHPQHIVLVKNLALHSDIRNIGEEVSQGQLLASTGQQLSVGAIASLSMAGIKHVTVFRYPKIAVVITGDEVAETVDDLSSEKIFDANAPLIQAWFQSHRHSVDIFHVEDTHLAVTALFNQLKDQYDAVISTGGVSVGDYDFVRPAALKLGFQQIFWKVKQKPGKPMLFALFQREDQTRCILIGLPGNPAAVYMGMQIYVSTILAVLQGQKKHLRWGSGAMQHDLKPDARERFLRMNAVFENGRLQLSSLDKQQSHMLSNLMHANCIVRVPAGEPIHAGQVLPALFIQN